MTTNARTLTSQVLTDADWFKSSYSDNGTNCVEIADNFPGIVPVRDSKNPHGPALVFPADNWASFVSSVKGEASE
ncbi:DUF397 domain-containing protein [Streptomyces sp. NPDC093085]|uniref:DUF397 domain-containing protein n=1 Tax=Streptomyces sp. NPDC093085 TaxID=3155068 RepID=UPI0034215E90